MRKATVEDHLTLSLKGMARKGCLHAGASGTTCWEWPDGSESSLGWRCTGDALWLSYATTDRYTGETRRHNYPVPLTSRPTPFGPQWYFLCPVCSTRVRKLQSADDGRFACRHCLDLTYGSRRRSKRHRKFRRNYGF